MGFVVYFWWLSQFLAIALHTEDFNFSSRRLALILLIYFQIPYVPVPDIQNSGVFWLSISKIMPDDGDMGAQRRYHVGTSPLYAFHFV